MWRGQTKLWRAIMHGVIQPISTQTKYECTTKEVAIQIHETSRKWNVACAARNARLDPLHSAEGHTMQPAVGLLG
jgi:hypothetical protein